ncbi:hypothetical protein [Jiangella rhizosphaerae]|uniref:Uncharacterized protein n=1 Tax=Jiangella rhizosphaerae TaxID=2293569 RepID=A0A418KH84_9ACTN|nr:hypothetical protein [Jiangella rhizosphaerae]RIQ11347.1 hypothetical protein DY240_29065 [Jiangella rhizosphaerae]
MKQRERRRAERLIWRVMSGRDKPPSITDPREAVVWVYGRNRTGNPDIAAAAADLGVSESTMRRWTHPDPERRATPTGENARKLRRMATRATRRRNASAQTRRSRKSERMRTRGATLFFAGIMTISNEKPRDRKTKRMQLPPEAAAMLNEAWESGDPTRFEETLEGLIDIFYFEGGVAGGAFIQSISELEFEPR